MALNDSKARRESRFNAASEYSCTATVFATWAEPADAVLTAGSATDAAIHAEQTTDVAAVAVFTHIIHSPWQTLRSDLINVVHRERNRS